mgnify:CR=1 FL=1
MGVVAITSCIQGASENDAVRAQEAIARVSHQLEPGAQFAAEIRQAGRSRSRYDWVVGQETTSVPPTGLDREDLLLVISAVQVRWSVREHSGILVNPRIALAVEANCSVQRAADGAVLYMHHFVETSPRYKYTTWGANGGRRLLSEWPALRKRLAKRMVQESFQAKTHA